MPIPVIQNLEGDNIRMSAGQIVHLDVGGDAILSQGTLNSLDIFFSNDQSTADHLGIDTQSSAIVLSNGLAPGSFVSVRLPDDSLVDIGSIANWSDQWTLSFEFEQNVAPALIAELLHAIVYQNTNGNLAAVEFRQITIWGSNSSGDTIPTVNLTIAPADMLILTPGDDHLTGSGGNDIFYSHDYGLSDGDRLDGGGGNDTLQLVSNEGSNSAPYFNISALAQFTGIATILGTDGDEGIRINGTQLADVTKIDGRGGENYLWIQGSDPVDLSGKEITNIKQIGLSGDGITVTVDNKATASLLRGFSEGDTLILTTVTLSQAERTALHNNGMDTITAISAETNTVVTTTVHPPRMTGLDGDHVAFDASGTVFIDAGRNVTITTDDALFSLEVYGPSISSQDRLELDTSGHVNLSGADSDIVSVDGVEIGTIAQLGMYLYFDFNSEATAARVQELIRALTFSNTDGAISQQRHINLFLGDVHQRSQAIETFIEPLGNTLTAGVDALTGTGGNDIFYGPAAGFTAGDQIDGGGGTDTLQLIDGHIFNIARLSHLDHVANIFGTAFDDDITIDTAQLKDVTTIDGKGGSNYLLISGTTINLTGKTITGFEEVDLVTNGATITVADKTMANLVAGFGTLNDTLILTSGTLDAAERLAIHRHGIDTIKAVFAETGQQGTDTFSAPEIAGLDGDHIVSGGSQPVFIDAGRNATIMASDDLSTVDVYVDKLYDTDSHLGINSSGAIKLSNGLHIFSKISVGGAEIGALATSSGSHLTISLNNHATPALVQELVRALTYSSTSNAAVTIVVSVSDVGSRYESARITIDPSPASPTDNHAPDRHHSERLVDPRTVPCGIACRHADHAGSRPGQHLHLHPRRRCRRAFRDQGRPDRRRGRHQARLRAGDDPHGQSARRRSG